MYYKCIEVQVVVEKCNSMCIILVIRGGGRRDFALLL